LSVNEKERQQIDGLGIPIRQAV